MSDVDVETQGVKIVGDKMMLERGIFFFVKGFFKEWTILMINEYLL